MTLTFPLTESTFIFKGPLGDLEMLTTPAESASNRQATAIICHPHPLGGGTMHNKVVTTLARVCRDLGLRTVRFNFRGAGKSAGIHDEGRGELEDTLAIIQWVQTLFPNEKIWLAGFSFGAYIAARAAEKIVPAQLITIAPQVSRFQQENELMITCPWILVQGEQDEIISPADVFTWIATLKHKPDVIRIADAGHFFHGKLLELRDRLEEKLL